MFDFPTNPASGTVVMVPDGSYRVWDSTKWRASPSSNSMAGGPFLPIAGGTMTGPLTIGTGTGIPTLTFDGAAGALKGINWRNAGTARWQLVTDASENMALYAFNASGGFLDTAWLARQDTSQVTFDYRLQVQTSRVSQFVGDNIGINVVAHNTGAVSGYGVAINYTSTAGDGQFDTGFGLICSFNPVFQGSTQALFEGAWLVVESPNDTGHTWNGDIAELNFVNRGPDIGFKRNFADAGNNTGGLLFVPMASVVSGTGGEGKNVGYAYAVAGSGDTNSTGFHVKSYIGFKTDQNSIAGLTGRGAYFLGDTTGVGSQIPYGPLQTDAAWLHGIDHTLATYSDGNAETLGAAQHIAWVQGTTASPTATAWLGSVWTGVLNLRLQPASGGTVWIGSGTGAQTLTIDGAAGQANGVAWQTANTTRYQLITDASDNLNINAFDAGGGYLGAPFSFYQSIKMAHVGWDLQVAGKVGFNGAAVAAKPAGWGAATGTATRSTFATSSVTLPVLAEHVKALIDDLTAYGLIGP